MTTPKINAGFSHICGKTLIGSALSLALIFAPGISWCQEHASHESEGNEPGWETVLSGVFFLPLDPEIREEGTAVGTELHLTYWFSHVWALGGSYTIQFESGGGLGNEIALIGSYKPDRWITINVGPSVGLPSEHGHEHLVLSAYVESEINFFIGQKFHLGPVVGGLMGEHAELFGGLHLGYEF